MKNLTKIKKEIRDNAEKLFKPEPYKAKDRTLSQLQHIHNGDKAGEAVEDYAENQREINNKAGRDHFESELMPFINHTIETAYQQGIKDVKLKKISESEGWDLAKKFNCCPGDNMADAYNLAVSNLNKLKKKLKL